MRISRPCVTVADVGDDLGLLTQLAPEFLAAALASSSGELVSCRTEHIDHQPGGGATAGYRVSVRWPGGRTTEERMGATTGRIRHGGFVLEDGASKVAVWRFPYDPDLPALPAATDPGSVAAMFSALGVDGAGVVRVRLRSYRPRRRAVVEAIGPRSRAFLKVVRPRRVQDLHDRHRALTAAGVPVPPSLGYTPDGVVILQAVPGRSMRDALRAGERRLPGAGGIVDLLDRLPADLMGLPRRLSPSDQAGHYAAVVATALPAHGALATDLAAQIGAELVPTAPVPIHGDLYESQLMIVDGRISGLLDIDTIGPGERVDDLACLLGHLLVLAQLDGGRGTAIRRLGHRYLAAFEDIVDPGQLRLRVAGVVLSLATGPYRVQQPGWPAATVRRLHLARDWLTRAGALRS
jgi:hypothetical protein